MNNCVKVTPSLSESLQEIGFKFGWTWNHSNVGQNVQYTDFPYLIIYDNKSFGGTHNPTDSFPEISLEEAIEKLTDLNIKVGSYKVEFKRDRVSIGCTSFSKKEVENIYLLTKNNCGGIVIDYNKREVSYRGVSTDFDTVKKICNKMK